MHVICPHTYLMVLILNGQLINFIMIIKATVLVAFVSISLFTSFSFLYMKDQNLLFQQFYVDKMLNSYFKLLDLNPNNLKWKNKKPKFAIIYYEYTD